MLYSDTAKITPNDKNEGCPRCGGAVFSAEEVIEKGLTYHKRCFTCISCNRPQVDKLQVHVGFDKQIYCKTCYPKIWHTPMEVESRAKIQATGEDSGCPRCGGKVFEAERMACKTGQFHKLCFTCKICNRLMNYTNFVDFKVVNEKKKRRNCDLRIVCLFVGWSLLQVLLLSPLWCSNVSP